MLPACLASRSRSASRGRPLWASSTSLRTASRPVAATCAATMRRPRREFAVSHGVREELVCLDPGIGFGKTVAQNFELIRRLDVLVALGRPVLVGASRKSSLGRIFGGPTATTGTTAASLGAAVAAY